MRTKQTRTDGSYVDYTYDGIDQLKTAKGKETVGTNTITRFNEQLSYEYDKAWNLTSRTNNALVQSFTLNQPSTSSYTGTLTVAGTTTSAATPQP